MAGFVRKNSAIRVALWLCLSTGCRCSALSGEVGDQSFTRCIKADPPAERKLKLGNVTLTVKGRVAELSGRTPARVAVFTGPVAASLSRLDVAELSALKPSMIWVLGGLGDDRESATATLSSLAGLAVPVLLLPGGADRLAVVEEALRGLAAGAADGLLLAAGLHELRIGRQRFALVSGAPEGRYAVDAEACGFVADDLEAVTETLRAGKGSRPWLLSWAAPAGSSTTTVAGAGDIGSPALATFMTRIEARGALAAWPECGQGGAFTGPITLPVTLVPRLGRSGTLRADGGRLARGVLLLEVSDTALVASP